MTSFVETLLSLALCGGPVLPAPFAAAAPIGLAQVFGSGAFPDSAATPTPVVSAAFADRVAGAIAERWSVDPGAIRLTWGRPPQTRPADDAPFRLNGAGADGRFVVVVRPGERDGAAIGVRAGTLDTVVVAARALAGGTRLAAGDLATQWRVAWGPPRPPGARPAPGWEVRRALAQGEPLAWPAVLAPPLIASGDPVRLVWSHGDVSVSMSGIALNSAAAGERFRARVEGRAVRVLAIATAPGVATLTEEGAR
jgi:flagella basal body P-ring formation protein FlgA